LRRQPRDSTRTPVWVLSFCGATHDRSLLPISCRPAEPGAALPARDTELAISREDIGPEEMRRLFERHRDAEAAHDYDAILATFVETWERRSETT
jgi:hypothetical protein